MLPTPTPLHMKKIVWTFGLISGAILSLLMVATMPFVDRIGFDKSMVVGYTTMVLSFLLAAITKDLRAFPQPENYVADEEMEYTLSF